MSAGPEDLVEVHLTVNGRSVEWKIPPRTTLRVFLGEMLDLRDVRCGCDEGVCGACTVLLDEQPVASCLLLAAQADGRQVVTAAGLEHTTVGPDAERLRLLRDQLLTREAFQCGYCACGMLVTAFHCIRSEKDVSAESVRAALAGNLCRCTGYTQIGEAIVAAASGELASRVEYPRIDLREKLAASIRYPTDHLAGALVGRMLWSAFPSARIVGIDLRDAAAIPGVEAVLTEPDIPGRNLAGGSIFGEDQRLLVSDCVRCMGDVVALVGARTERAAREAIRRIRVEYEPLEPVTDLRASIEPDAPRIRPHGNVINQFIEIKGDIDAGFRAADAVVEETYQNAPNDHGCMELEGGAGWFEGEVLVLAIPHQSPHVARKNVARVLGIPEDRVRIEAPRMGGSFGKYTMWTIEAYLALLIHQTRKPVRLVLDRTEMIARRTKRHPSLGRYRLGLKRDGTFMALEADILADAGPYIALTPAVSSVIAAEGAGAYEIPNMHIRSRGVLTNNLPTAPMRGYGSQQISFGIECIVEKAARTLGIDPAQLRQKNFKRTQTDGRGRLVPESRVWLGETMRRVVGQLGERPQAPPGWLLGRGVASIHAKYGYPYGTVDRFVARVSVDQEGRFSVESDVADSGTGVTAAMTKLVAEYLRLDVQPEYRFSQAIVDDPSGFCVSRGLPSSRSRRFAFRSVEWVQTQSARGLVALMARLEPSTSTKLLRLVAVPMNFLVGLTNRIKSGLFPLGLDAFSPRFGSSRGILLGCRAALDAAARLKDAALASAAHVLREPAATLEVDGAGAHRVGKPDGTVTWAELARHGGGTLAGVGEAHLPNGWLFDPTSGNQMGSVDHMDATHGCDLAVDPMTGEVRILRYVACHDAGRVINPHALRGQLIGGVAMGVGQALFESLHLDRGKVLTTGLHDYLVPTSLDVPEDIEIVVLESESGLGPRGAKGVGESAAVAAPAAVANALYDAIGAQLNLIPATPEDIVALINRQNVKAIDASA